MAHERSTGWIPRLVGLGATLAFAGVVVGACNGPPGGGGGDDEHVGVAQSRVFTNGGFETGTANNPPPSWNVNLFLNPDPNGVTNQTPQTLAGLNLFTPGGACTGAAQCAGVTTACVGGKCVSTADTIIVAATNAADPDLGATASLRICRYGAQCALVNKHGKNNNVNSMTQTMTIGAGDVDPTDGKIHVRFVAAPVLQLPTTGHTLNQEPYYFVNLTNVTQGTTLYNDFNLSGQPGVQWKVINPGAANQLNYTDWQLVDISPGGTAINMGDMVNLQVIGGGCSLGGHWGEVYVDGVGTSIPGLYVSGTGPAQANPGTNITYDLTYKNGAATSETGVVIDFTAPPGTTITSFTNPPGATCVQAAQTITCTFTGAVTAGQTGNFTVTVAIAAATTCTTSANCATGVSCVNGFCDVGEINCGNYGIASTQESHLLGNKITTILGCTVDSQCPAGAWCDESKDDCTPTLANGQPIPTDPPHTGPTLNGTCAAAGAGTLVCTSKVCDTDNDCGYKNGDGPCTAGPTGNGAVVCRSGVCDPDLKCGYANGDGPCTVANGGTVCRSGVCSNDGLCIAAGTCNVDADCTGGKWCDESTHTCTAKLPNGQPVPSNPPHTSPTLNGMCNAGAGTLVCVSGVCDTTDNECGYKNSDGPCTVGNEGTVCRSAVCDGKDDLCGYANGDGPCTVANGGTVCRSGTCSISGVCEPSGGCSVDADCAGGNWCDESTHVCTAKLANGQPIPSDPPHTSPTLNATCTPAAAMLVCVSGVCDVDNACGYANGDGPCTMATGGSVCRSGTCSMSGVCEPMGGCVVDTDCPATDYCNTPAFMCVPKQPNGQPVPTVPGHNPALTGTCDPAAGVAACVSGVCDTSDNLCGYATGDGPCDMTSGPTVCRSGTCSTNGTCEPAGGCNVDADCSAGNWCNETAHTCTPTGANGVAVGNDPAHTNPTLDGTCTAASGMLTCTSGVCDTNDNECGYANGDGPCTTGNAGTVCRSGACSTNGTCEPVGGCNVDADCSAGNWCNESAHACTPTIANGMTVGTDPGHASPVLDGTCTAAAGALTCTSGVCDTNDNECGYANGDGPCTTANGGTVCRSGTCSASGVCEPSGGCSVDADCASGTWCNETTHTCSPTVANGMMVPSDPGHTTPTLNGTCTAAAGALTCTSGVCDTDNLCGYKNGDGPCTQGNGDAVCRSTLCGTNGTCVGCTMDSQCSAPTPVCNTAAGNCVQCTMSSQCTNTSMAICDMTSFTCAPCNGDNGSGANDACPTTGQPFCFLSGANQGTCGKCSTDSDCAGHTGGNICNTTTGLCVSGCDSDSQCLTTQWCNNPQGGTGQCVPKLPNGQMLPSSPSDVATCSAMVGARVCVSGVCDTKDNTCGYANGDGPCSDNGQCRDNTCDSMTMTCMMSSSSSSSSSSGSTGNCVTDADCTSGDFCQNDNCVPKLGIGQACTRPTQCQSADCTGNVCSDTIGSGNGVICSASPGRSSSSGGTAGLFGLMLAAAGLARRRSSSRK